MGGTLNKMSAVYRRIAGNYGSTNAPCMFEVFNSLGEMFSTVSATCKQLDGMMSENFDKYFRYHTHEVAALEVVTGEWFDERAQYTRLAKKLKERKETMYAQKQIDKWEVPSGCPYSIDILFKDKTLAFTQMLPNDTQEVAHHKKVFGFYCNKVLDEYKRICLKNDITFREHFIGVGKMSCEIFERVSFQV